MYVPVVPTITKIATDGSDGIVKDSAFDATGTNLSFTTGDTVVAKWTEGSEAKEKSLTPSATTATKMSFAAVTEFASLANDTPVTFEFELAGVALTKATTIQSAS